MTEAEVEARRLRGIRVGEVVKALWALICSHPQVASWDSAIFVVENYPEQTRVGRASLRADLSLLRSVSHWWGAYALARSRVPV